MDLTVLGCHGGETPKHRTSSFLINGVLALDAGAITSQLSLPEQARIQSVLVSHAHMDHIRDLATLADNRCQQGGPTLEIVGTADTLADLRAHFFNDRLWPDFTRIQTDRGPTIHYRQVESEVETEVCGLTVLPVPVSHTIDSSGFVISNQEGSLAYSGDTGPTERFWEILNETDDLTGLIMEVSFPNEQASLAQASGHHTTESLAVDLAKLRAPEALPIFLFHIKPVFQAQVERELAKIGHRNLQVLELGDEFVF